jgi:hypothetical protein
MVHERNIVVYGKHQKYIKIGGFRIWKGYDSYHKDPYVEYLFELFHESLNIFMKLFYSMHLEFWVQFNRTTIVSLLWISFLCVRPSNKLI